MRYRAGSDTGSPSGKMNRSSGARRPATAGPAMDGAARATAARQLASGAVQAYPRARSLVLVAATTPCSYRNGDSSSFLSTTVEPAPSRYKRGPRAPPSTQATPGHPHSTPAASNRRGRDSFLVSGQFGRRHAPVPYVASIASPVLPAPQSGSPRPCGATQHPSLDREPP